MSKTLAIIDYGMGNLRSVQKAFERVGSNAIITSKSSDIDSVGKIVLPGVGAFKDAMNELDRRRLIEPLKRNIAAGKYFFGICLGLQLLFCRSYEDGIHDGLNILAGNVLKFTDDATAGSPRLKIPHMGWNRIKFRDTNSPIIDAVPDGTYMYFVHSYYVSPTDAGIVAGETDHGVCFPSIVSKDNIFATQFHPEKSHKTGLDILKNFSDLK